MKIKEILDSIFHVSFNTRNGLDSTFLRFQEHYESPEFRGKFFTLDDYKRWYTANSPDGKKTGRFTYYEDFDGFNIPSCILTPFLEGKFDPLSENERTLLTKFEREFGRRNFYIIGTFGDDQLTLQHETSHGLFCIDPDYRKKTLELIMQINQTTREKIYNELIDTSGYHPDVFDDELHAYLIDGEGFDSVDANNLEMLSAELQDIFEKTKRMHR